MTYVSTIKPITTVSPKSKVLGSAPPIKLLKTYPDELTTSENVDVVGTIRFQLFTVPMY